VKIFSNSSTFSRVQKKEACAINLARIVSEEELESVTRIEIRQAENYGIEKPYDISGPFEDTISAEKWCIENLTYGKSHHPTYNECGEGGIIGDISGTHINYRSKLIKILNEKDTRKLSDLKWGVIGKKSAARIRPILSEGDKFKYLVIYDKSKKN
jgi:hypothetical protein